jgi:hypothetical protein
VALPVTDHVARTCKASSVDSATGTPTPASFAFRLDEEGTWKDTYLSVNWLEYLHPGEDDLPAKIATLRTFLGGDHLFPVMKPSKNGVLAAIPVSKIHDATIEEIATVLECKHVSQGDGDAHSGIYPVPGVENWPAKGDAPEHLAIQLYLFQSVCHTEAAFPK